MKYILATSRSWHEPMAERLEARTGHTFELITSRKELTPERLETIRPEAIFFPHWSYMIPPEVFDSYECVIFHMTDLPYGRGGSPLQNLIARGVYETRLSALKCVEAVDAGPVYLKRPLSLHGNAEEIFIRAGKVMEEMIVELIETRPEPAEQVGEPVLFKRRQPEQSRIGDLASLDKLYDHIRMLDAEGYPRAFLEHRGFRYEFSRAALVEGRLIADVTITETEDE
jgi:methionyl-tRNA formyltransferase